MLKTIEDLRPYLIKGIPEMGVPSMDPLLIPGLSIQTGNGTNFGYTVQFKDLIFTGAKDFEIADATIDMGGKLFKMKMRVPLFSVVGQYKSAGKVLLLQFEGEGEVKANISKSIC